MGTRAWEGRGRVRRRVRCAASCRPRRKKWSAGRPSRAAATPAPIASRCY